MGCKTSPGQLLAVAVVAVAAVAVAVAVAVIVAVVAVVVVVAVAVADRNSSYLSLQLQLLVLVVILSEAKNPCISEGSAATRVPLLFYPSQKPCQAPKPPIFMQQKEIRAAD
jgi:hypothetical protein